LGRLLGMFDGSLRHPLDVQLRREVNSFCGSEAGTDRRAGRSDLGWR